MIIRVFRSGSSAKCSAGGPTKNRNSFTTASVSSGAADLVRDEGFNAAIDYKPVPYLDLAFLCNSTATRWASGSISAGSRGRTTTDFSPTFADSRTAQGFFEQAAQWFRKPPRMVDLEDQREA